MAYVHYPILGPDSMTAAEASECAASADASQFWDYHNLLYAKQGIGFTRENLVALAGEMGLDTAMAIRTGFPGPTYVDLHSLFLGVSAAGLRVPQLLPSWGKWLRSFDAAQVNEEEFGLLGRDYGDPWAMASEVVGPDLKLLAVTLGGEGSAYVAGAGFRPDPGEWPGLRRRMAIPGPATSRKIPGRSGTLEGDPTGCGDVWGATFFSRLLAGDALDAAMEFANEAAARNVTFRGARGLHLHLSGRLAPVEEQR